MAEFADEFDADTPVSDAQPVRGFNCPYCDHAIPVEQGDEPQEVQCENCGGLVVIPSLDGRTEVEDEVGQERLLHGPVREDELDGLKVRNLSVARRATIRARTYALVAAVGCIYAIIKSITGAADVVRVNGWSIRPVVYIFLGVVLVFGLLHFLRRFFRLTRELKTPDHHEDGPLAPPDFTKLSDGSQYWKNLDGM